MAPETTPDVTAPELPITPAAVVTPSSEPDETPPPDETGEMLPPADVTTAPEPYGAPDLVEGRVSGETTGATAPSTETEPLPPSEESPATSLPRGFRRDRQRPLHGNALGMLIEQHFADPTSPCRSYSDLERRSGISREALSRYVTARPDRRRSPTIDTLVAIADAMHLSLEAICRGAAASVKGTMLPPEETQHEREEVLSSLLAGLSDEQFSAIVELLRQMHPAAS